MKRKIITDNTSRTIKKKPKTEEQIKKAVEKYAVDPPLKFQLGQPVSPGQALGDFLKKKAEQTHNEFKKDAVSAYVIEQQSLNPHPFLGGQAIATSGYQAWKPGNTPNAAEIEAMLKLLGGGDPSQLNALVATKSDDWAGKPIYKNGIPWDGQHWPPIPKEKK